MPEPTNEISADEFRRRVEAAFVKIEGRDADEENAAYGALSHFRDFVEDYVSDVARSGYPNYQAVWRWATGRAAVPTIAKMALPAYEKYADRVESKAAAGATS